MPAVLTPERLDRFAGLVRANRGLSAAEYATLAGVSYEHASRMLRKLCGLRRIKRTKAGPRSVRGPRLYLYA